MVEYAKRQGINIDTLRYWSVKLNKQKRAMSVAAEIVPGKFVTLLLDDEPSHAPESPASVYTLELSGMTLRMSELPAPEWLAALGRAMRGAL